MKTLGIVLLLLGFIVTIVTGFTIITRKDVVDLGHVEFQMRADKAPIYWSPITGVALIVAGTAFVSGSMSGSRGRKSRGR